MQLVIQNLSFFSCALRQIWDSKIVGLFVCIPTSAGGNNGATLCQSAASLLHVSQTPFSKEQCRSWEEEIPHILWNPKVHYRIIIARHLSSFLASSIQSIPPQPTSWRSILILSSHLRLGLPSGLFPTYLQSHIKRNENAIKHHPPQWQCRRAIPMLRRYCSIDHCRNKSLLCLAPQPNPPRSLWKTLPSPQDTHTMESRFENLPHL